MATTRQNLRRNLSYLMGDFILDPSGPVPTCSAQGASDYSTAVDALLAYYDNDYFNEWFFVLPDGPTGSGTYEVTRVSDFTSSSGTMTLSPVASARIASGQTFELHRYHPAWKHLALNAARLQAADVLWAPQISEPYVVDNILDNWDFANWDSSSVATNWANKNTPTVAQETVRMVHGSYSIKVTATGATEGVEQNILTVYPSAVNISEIESKTLHVRGWIWASVADAARIRVTYDGSTYDNSSYHSGSSEWEGPGLIFIDSSISMPSSGEEMTVSCEVTAGNTAYFDIVAAWIDPIVRYNLPSAIYRLPTAVRQQSDRDRPGINGRYTHLTRSNPPISGRILRVEGKGLLSEVTTEAGTMQVSEPEDQILYAHALEWLADSNIGMASGVARADIEADKQRWRVKAAELRSRASIRPPYQVIFAQQNGAWEPQLGWGGAESGYILLKNR
jgi:hypothetical protein